MAYYITYKIYKNDKLIDNKTRKVKNKVNEYFAKGGLEMWLHEKFDFDRIEFIKCVSEIEIDDDMVERFKDLFGMN